MMTMSVRFARTCPTCGRTLEIPVELLGREVCCHGCGASFRATDKALDHRLPTQAEDIDTKVDRLIQAADKQLSQYSPINVN